MDENEVSEWFAEYLRAFEALGRGEATADTVSPFYAVPLTVTTDDGVVAIDRRDEVEAWIGGQAAGLAEVGYHHTETLEGGFTVVNASTALHRATFSRQRADGSEIARMGVTYLITCDAGRFGLSTLAVHSPVG
ncbi:hypothetical protein [Nocardioides solisilvae]|uniref:DUF6841 family protein n=1 Tax=Nocardioides solisilvae TaxID=1542435 RepID=UPI000D741ACF|nr:hypothetical protein [Nocardioides solisilvae]